MQEEGRQELSDGPRVGGKDRGKQTGGGRRGQRTVSYVLCHTPLLRALDYRLERHLRLGPMAAVPRVARNRDTLQLLGIFSCGGVANSLASDGVRRSPPGQVSKLVCRGAAVSTATPHSVRIG